MLHFAHHARLDQVVALLVHDVFLDGGEIPTRRLKDRFVGIQFDREIGFDTGVTGDLVQRVSYRFLGVLAGHLD